MMVQEPVKIFSNLKAAAVQLNIVTRSIVSPLRCVSIFLSEEQMKVSVQIDADWRVLRVHRRKKKL
jgi:hypothetical protein